MQRKLKFIILLVALAVSVYMLIGAAKYSYQFASGLTFANLASQYSDGVLSSLSDTARLVVSAEAHRVGKFFAVYNTVWTASIYGLVICYIAYLLSVSAVGRTLSYGGLIMLLGGGANTYAQLVLGKSLSDSIQIGSGLALFFGAVYVVLILLTAGGKAIIQKLSNK